MGEAGWEGRPSHETRTGGCPAIAFMSDEAVEAHSHTRLTTIVNSHAASLESSYIGSMRGQGARPGKAFSREAGRGGEPTVGEKGCCPKPARERSTAYFCELPALVWASRNSKGSLARTRRLCLARKSLGCQLIRRTSNLRTSGETLSATNAAFPVLFSERRYHASRCCVLPHRIAQRSHWPELDEQPSEIEPSLWVVQADKDHSVGLNACV